MDLYIIGAGNIGGFISYHAEDMGGTVTDGFVVKGFLDTYSGAYPPNFSYKKLA